MENTSTLYGVRVDLMQKHQQTPSTRAYKARGEEYVPLGVHGTMVAVDWDSCYADGACIEACPYRYSSGIEQNKMFQQ